MEGYEPGGECAQCKGRCCKEKGCSLAPEDMFRELKERRAGSELREEILLLLKDHEKGFYAIDYFSTGNGPLFYLRMRHKCYTFIGVDAMGECIALGPDGCGLSKERRPKGGRFLESNKEMHCIQHYTREMMEADWSPYQEELSSIWKEYDEIFKADGTYDRCDTAYFEWMKKQS